MVGKLVDIGGFSWSCHDFLDKNWCPTRSYPNMGWISSFLGQLCIWPQGLCDIACPRRCERPAWSAFWESLMISWFGRLQKIPRWELHGIIYIYYTLYIISILYIIFYNIYIEIEIDKWSFLSRGIGQNLDEHQDEVRLVGLRDVVFVDASAVALQPILEDVDEDAARMFLESNP